MSTHADRAEDPRSLYTKSMIKGSLLELLKTHSYTSISVTMLSEKAGIGRNTFYRHFNNTFDVLEAAIDDALEEIFAVFKYLGLDASDQFGSYIAPICEYVKNSDRYKVVFTDTELSSLITERMLAMDDGRFITALQKSGSYSPSQAQAVARFQIAGLLETCTRYGNAKDEEWADIVAGLDSFTRALY